MNLFERSGTNGKGNDDSPQAPMSQFHWLDMGKVLNKALEEYLCVLMELVESHNIFRPNEPLFMELI